MEQEAEKIPATKGSQKRKMKVDEMPKLISAMEVDSFDEGFLSKGEKIEEEEEERIPLIEVFRRMNMPKNVHKKILRLSEEKRKLKYVTNSEDIRKKGLDGDGFSEKEKEKSESESESESENISRSPVEIKGYSYYFKTEVHGYPPKKEESESEEEVLGDRDRVENDRGYKFVVKKRWRTVTNPQVPEKIYFKSKVKRHKGRKERVSIPSVLHDPDFPLAALSKLALKTYNKIQKTEYEYVGLVKAYKLPVNGFHFWTRFKARLPGQDAINFQAITFQERPDPNSKLVPVRFESVYPLPPS